MSDPCQHPGGAILPIIKENNRIYFPPPVPPKGGSDNLGYPAGGKKRDTLKIRKRPPASIATGVVVRLPGRKKSIMEHIESPIEIDGG